MAKKLKDEDLVLNIIVNGDKGRSEMAHLTRALSDMGSELATLENEKKKLTDAGKENTDEWRENEAAIVRTNTAIVIAEDRLKALRGGLKLTDMSVRDLSREQRRLKALMEASAPGSENYLRYRNELNLVRARLREVGGEAQRASFSLGKMANGINRYIGLAAAFTGSVTMGVMAARKASEAYAEYDDKLADVMKTTGLAKQDVEDLSVSLSKINTRTSQLELLGLARQAGKLGISAKDDVEAFVVAADKIGVALGEDLGDTEQAINSMGKLVDLFKVKDDYGMADGMIRVGSAVNALGASSTANEGYIVDFTKQVGGMAHQAGMSIQNVLGVASTLDMFGQRSEASATVIGRIISGMHKNTKEYAAVARMSVKEFTDLMTKDANEAMLRVFENMGGGGMQKVVGLLGDLGEEGVRATQVLSTLSSNAATLRYQQALANAEFEKGTSILDEYSTKNESAQAKLEKARKVAQERLVELGRILQPVMTSMTSGFSTLIRALSSVVKFFIEYKLIIYSVTAATVAYIVVQKISISWSKIQAYWCGINTKAIVDNTGVIARASIGTKLLASAKMLLSGQFKAAAVAVKLFFKALGPIGWAITAVTFLVGAMKLSSKPINEISRGLAEMAMKIKQERDSLSELQKSIAENKEGSKARLAAIKILNDRYGEYLPNLIAEKDSNEDIAIAIQSVNDKLAENIRLKFRDTEIERVKQEQFNAERSILTNLSAEYGKSGNKTLAQLDLANVKFVEIIDNLKITGDKTVFATQLASVFGEEWGRVNYLGSRGRGGNQVNQLYDLITNSFVTITLKAKETASAISMVNALVGGAGQDKSAPGNVDVTCPACGKTPCECFKIKADKEKKWTLENDTAFNEQRVALKQKQLAGQYSTQEEYSREILALEIRTLEARIATNKDKGEEMSKIKEQLLDKQLAQAEQARKREESLVKIAQGGDPEADKAKRSYDDRLRATGLFERDLSTLTTTEKAARLQIDKEYNSTLVRLHLTQINKDIERKKEEVEKKVAQTKAAQDAELVAATTLEAKKAILSEWFSTEELRHVTSSEEAAKLIRAKYAEDQNKMIKDELTTIAQAYGDIVATIESDGGLLDGAVKMTEQEAEQMRKIVEKLQADIAKLKDPEENPAKIEKKKVDVLGMSVDDWSTLFSNTDGGLTGLEKMAIAAKAIGDAFAEVSELMSAIEQREFKKFESTQNKKKQALDRQLAQGVISQERYNGQVQMIESETEEKRVEMERKQAERQKMLAIFSAITSTAVAVVSALGSQPFGPWNIALAAIVGAIGAVQIATIAAQPLPGLEEGGRIRVQREQDGKMFDADYDPHYRGWVDKPKVIVGEGSGRELVIPASAESNPTVRPVLDILGRAIARKEIRSINLTQEMQRVMMPGLSDGGRVPRSNGSRSDQTSAKIENYGVADPVLLEFLRENRDALRQLAQRLDHPITAEVAMTGSKGIVSNIDKYNRTRSRATIGRG